jgi:hypothetical protein
MYSYALILPFIYYITKKLYASDKHTSLLHWMELTTQGDAYSAGLNGQFFQQIFACNVVP